MTQQDEITRLRAERDEYKRCSQSADVEVIRLHAEVEQLRLQYLWNLRLLAKQKVMEGVSASLMTNIEKATSDLMEAVVRDRTQSLRAEVEQLTTLHDEALATLFHAKVVEHTAVQAELDDALQRIHKANRERDEALARLANCGQENCFGWKLKGYTNWVTEDRYKEALAQVAVLVQAIEGARHPADMPNEGDIQFWYERLSHVLADTPNEARTLLDRLQRAEAVVELAQRIARFQGKTAPWLGIPQRLWTEFLETLAAWEEGKA